MKPLAVISCIHIGDPSADIASFKKTVSIAIDEDWNVVFVGDIINNGQVFGTKHIGCHWDDIYIPGKQFEIAYQLMRPISKRILGVISGNHSGRTWKATSFDPEGMLADRLGVPRWEPGHIAKVGKYRMYFSHGTGTNDFRKALNIVENIDVIAIGHTHELKYEIVKRGNRNIHMVRCGTFMRYPRYAREAMYAPKPTGFPVLFEHRGRINCRMEYF